MTARKPRCPVCGKTALRVRRYDDGSAMGVHKERVVSIGGFGFCEVLESCHLASSKVQS